MQERGLPGAGGIGGVATIRVAVCGWLGAWPLDAPHVVVVSQNSGRSQRFWQTGAGNGERKSGATGWLARRWTLGDGARRSADHKNPVVENSQNMMLTFRAASMVG